ncbi:MAG: phospholipase D-like domain-containing protein [Candidatus Firestonebacteria bacterium]
MPEIYKKSVSEIFSLDCRYKLKGFLGFTYSFDGNYFKEYILNNLNIKSRAEIKKLEFFKIIVHFSQIKQISNWLYDKKVIVYNSRKRTSFHPKLYIIKYDKNTNRKENKIFYRIIIGSFNLTKAGLNNNYEYAFVKEFPETNTNKTSNLNKFVSEIYPQKNIKIKIDFSNGSKFIFQNNNCIYEQIFADKKNIKEIHLISPFWGEKCVKKIIKEANGKKYFYYNSEKDFPKEIVRNSKDIYLFKNTSDRSISSEENSEIDESIKLILENEKDKKIFKHLNKIVDITKKEWLVSTEQELNRKIRTQKNNKEKIIDIFKKNLENDITYRTYRTFNHAKIIYIKYKDNTDKIFIGSSNITSSGLGLNNRKNIECGVIIKNPKIKIDQILKISTRKSYKQQNDIPCYEKDNEKNNTGNNGNNGEKNNYILDDIKGEVRDIKDSDLLKKELQRLKMDFSP